MSNFLTDSIGRFLDQVVRSADTDQVKHMRLAEALLTDIVLLSEARTHADLGAFREELSRRRRAIGPPSG